MSCSKNMKVRNNPRLTKVAESAISMAESAATCAKYVCGEGDPNEILSSPDVSEARQVKTLIKARGFAQRILRLVASARGDEMEFLQEVNLFYSEKWNLIVEETPTVEKKHIWVLKVQHAFLPGKGYEFQSLRKRLLGVLSSIRELLPDNWDALKREGLVS